MIRASSLAGVRRTQGVEVQTTGGQLRRRPHHLAWLAAVGLGALLSALAAALAWQVEAERAEGLFVLAASDRFDAVERRVESMLGDLHILHNLLAYEDTGPAEFAAVVQAIVSRLPSVQQIAWAPAEDRAGRCAIAYSAGGGPQRYPPGLELRAHAELNSLVNEALARGDYALGHRMDGDAHLILLVHPVYAQGRGPDDPPLQGLLLTVQDAGALVRVAVAGLVPRGVDLTLTERDGRGAPTLLYHYRSPLGRDAARRPRYAHAAIEHEIPLGKVTWVLTAIDTVGAPTDAPLPWAVLVGGLLFTTLLGVYVASLTGQRERYARLILRLQEEVAERRRAQDALTRLAHHDPLTGLANRALFTDRLQQALAHAARAPERLAVLFLDLDGFKAINDTLGHEQGDAALCAIARRLEGAVRREDTVARLGGDEFTVLYRDLAGPAEAERLAQKILALLEEPVALRGEPWRLGASIGISLYPDTGTAPAVLLQQADQAMYAAKQAGKGAYRVYAPAPPAAPR